MNISWPAFLVICGALIVIVLVLVLPIPRLRRKASTFSDRSPTPDVFRDDDRYWYGGFLYNNPDDPAMFVPRRFGLGWSLNFGHPQAKWFLISILVVMLLMVVVVPLLVALLGGGHPTGCHTFGCQP